MFSFNSKLKNQTCFNFNDFLRKIGFASSIDFSNEELKHTIISQK